MARPSSGLPIRVRVGAESPENWADLVEDDSAYEVRSVVVEGDLPVWPPDGSCFVCRWRFRGGTV